MSSFLQDRDDHPLMRHVTTSSSSSTASGPSVRTQSQFKGSTGRPSSHTSASGSRHGTSVTKSVGGLTRGSTAYSSSAATSHGANHLPRSAVAAIGEYGVWVPQSPPAIPIYQCPFDRLNCLDTFTEYQPWYEHSLIHFRPHGPPANASCGFCNDRFEKEKPGRAWEARMKHVQLHHDRGEQLRTSRYDAELYRYLWKKGVINDLEYRDLGQDTSSNTAGPSTNVHGHGHGPRR